MTEVVSFTARCTAFVLLTRDGVAGKNRTSYPSFAGKEPQSIGGNMFVRDSVPGCNTRQPRSQGHISPGRFRVFIQVHPC